MSRVQFYSGCFLGVISNLQLWWRSLTYNHSSQGHHLVIFPSWCQGVLSATASRSPVSSRIIGLCLLELNKVVKYICTLICSRAFGLSDKYLTAIMDVVDTVSYPEYMRVMSRSMIWSSLSLALVPSLPLKSESSMSSWVQPEDLRSMIICLSIATSFFLAWKTASLLLEGSVQLNFPLMLSGMQGGNRTWSPLL